MNSGQRTDLRFNKFGFILQASNLIPFLTVREQFKLVDKFTHKSKKKNPPLTIKLCSGKKTTTQ